MSIESDKLLEEENKRLDETLSKWPQRREQFIEHTRKMHDADKKLFDALRARMDKLGFSNF